MDGNIAAGSLVLRSWQSGDEDALARILETSSNELGEWLPGLLRDLADPRAYLDRAAVARRDRSAYSYAIVDDGTPVGQCSIDYRGDDVAEIGYWIRTDRTGRGLATTAVKAVAAAAFRAGVRELVIKCDAGNARSAAVACNAGFTHVGTVDLDPNLPRTQAQTGREMTWIRHNAKGD